MIAPGSRAQPLARLVAPDQETDLTGWGHPGAPCPLPLLSPTARPSTFAATSAV
jgi:hypothetical protein